MTTLEIENVYGARYLVIEKDGREMLVDLGDLPLGAVVREKNFLKKLRVGKRVKHEGIMFVVESEHE